MRPPNSCLIPLMLSAILDTAILLRLASRCFLSNAKNLSWSVLADGFTWLSIPMQNYLRWTSLWLGQTARQAGHVQGSVCSLLQRFAVELVFTPNKTCYWAEFERIITSRKFQSASRRKHDCLITEWRWECKSGLWYRYWRRNRKRWGCSWVWKSKRWWSRKWWCIQACSVLLYSAVRPPWGRVLFSITL